MTIEQELSELFDELDRGHVTVTVSPRCFGASTSRVARGRPLHKRFAATGVLALTVAGLLFLAACGRGSTSTTGTDTSSPDSSTPPAGTANAEGGAIDGPVLRHPKRTYPEKWPAAEVSGVVSIEELCIYVTLEGSDDRYPVLWPAATTWNTDTGTIVLPTGQSIANGDHVYGSGSYIDVENVRVIAGDEAAERAGRCVESPGGRIAVVNNFDTAIAPVQADSA